MERTARWFLLTGPYCIFERLLREYIFKVLATQKKVTLWGYGCVKSPSCGNYFAVYKITMLCTLNVHNAIFQWYLNDARGIEYWTYKISLENLLVGRNGWLVTFAGPEAWIYLIYRPIIFFFFLPHSMPWGSSRARDWIRTKAVTWATAVAEPPGNFPSCLFLTILHLFCCHLFKKGFPLSENFLPFFSLSGVSCCWTPFPLEFFLPEVHTVMVICHLIAWQ